MSQSACTVNKNLQSLSTEGKTLLGYLKAEFSQFKEEISSQLINEFTKIKADLIKQHHAEIKTLQDKVSSLEVNLSAANKKNDHLEDELRSVHKRNDDADQYSRKDSVILSGPALPPFAQEENTAQVVQKLLKDHLNVDLTDVDISTTHRLGPLRNNTPGKRNIYVKLVRRDTKRLIISTCKGKRNGQLYANESLTPLRKKMFNTLRKMKKDVPSLVKGTSTLDGKVFAYTPPINGNTRDQRHLISDWDALKEFCRLYVKKPLDNFHLHE